MIIEDKRTEFPFLDLFSRESENGYKFRHYFDDYLSQRMAGFLDLGINPKAKKKIPDAFEYFYEGAVARAHRFCRLVIPDISQWRSYGRHVRREER